MKHEEALRELRARAEAKARELDLPSKLNADPIRLLHELQVHQIELEIQNEELVAANHELDALRLKFESLYHSAPVGYFTLSLAGKVIECNDEALRLLGHDARHVVGRTLAASFDAGSRAAYAGLMASVQATGNGVAEELMVVRTHGVPVYARAHAKLMDSPRAADSNILLVLSDVSALKYARDDVASIIRREDGSD